MSLSDFLNRRFIPATRVIGRTGERYSRLRQRIKEVADLTNVHLQAEQRDEHRQESRRQTRLLKIAEFFGEAAVGYYAASLLADSIQSACGDPTQIFHVCQQVPTLAIKTGIYLLGVAAVLVLWGMSIFRLFKEAHADRENLPKTDIGGSGVSFPNRVTKTEN
jgi:uncharacterized membrane-anchored protein